MLDPGNPDDVYWAGGRPSSDGPRTSRRSTSSSRATSADGRCELRPAGAPAGGRARDRRSRGRGERRRPGGDGGPSLQVRFSRIETLRHADFAALDARELAEAWALIDRLRLVGAPRASRRPLASRRTRGRPDLRRTVRHAIRAGGEPIRRAHTQTRRAVPTRRAAGRRLGVDGGLRTRPAALRPCRSRRLAAGSRRSPSVPGSPA